MPREAYVRLSVNYYLDPKIIAAGDAAELLFLRIVACAGRNESDGFVTHDEIRRLAPARSKVARNTQRLRDLDLIREQPGGYRVTKWKEWQRSRDEIAAIRERNAARQRAYRERRNGVTEREDDALLTRPETETETETEKRRTASARRRPAKKPTTEIATVESENAGRLIKEWIDHRGQQPEKLIGHAGKELSRLLAEGFPYERVRAGFAAWADSDIRSPSVIPQFVSRAGQPNGRSRSTTDERVNGALALARRFEEEGQ